MPTASVRGHWQTRTPERRLFRLLVSPHRPRTSPCLPRRRGQPVHPPVPLPLQLKPPQHRPPTQPKPCYTPPIWSQRGRTVTASVASVGWVKPTSHPHSNFSAIDILISDCRVTPRCAARLSSRITLHSGKPKFTRFASCTSHRYNPNNVAPHFSDTQWQHCTRTC